MSNWIALSLPFRYSGDDALCMEGQETAGLRPDRKHFSTDDIPLNASKLYVVLRPRQQNSRAQFSRNLLQCGLPSGRCA
jgi:hypothetical protein